MHKFLMTIAALAGALSMAPSADATCIDPTIDSSEASDSIGASALSPAAPHPTLGLTAVVSSTTLHIRSTSDMKTVDTAALSDAAENLPNPVHMNDGSYGVFIAQQDGIVRRIDPENPGTGIDEWSVDLKSCGLDTLTATPVVHLRRFATDSFKATYATDLVYVATSHRCGTTPNEDNQIIALNAKTGTVLWTFNSGGALSMDVVHESPFLDVSEDRLIVATDRTASSSQHSLWSIDVITGTKAWSANVGQIYTTPVVRGDRIYLATLFGDMKAINKSDGSSIWSLSNGGIPIMTNIFAEFRPPYGELIAAVDFFGDVWLVRDDDSYGSSVWTTSLVDPEDGVTAPAATSRVAIEASSGKIYVGADDGQVYQLNVVDGAVEATRAVDVGGTVGDASFVFEGSNIQMVAGSSKGQLAKFCTPWTAETIMSVMSAAPGANLDLSVANPGLCSNSGDCGLAPTACSSWACRSGVCVATPKPDGGGCTDLDNNTSGDECNAGVCKGYSECQLRPDACSCTDANGNFINPRKLLVEADQPITCPAPPMGFDVNITQWCGIQTTMTVGQNACLDHGSGAQTAIWIHLVDRSQMPFDISTANGTISMEVCPTCNGSGDAPQFLDPITFNPLTASSVSLADGGLLASSQVGTYYAYVAARPSGQPGVTGEPYKIRATVTMSDGGTCIDTDQSNLILDIPVTMGNGGSDCGFNSDTDNMGFLRVRALNGSGAPLSDAPVQLGNAPDKFFAKSFEESVTNTPSFSNLQATNGSGVVTFLDYGNYMNGPIRAYATCPGGTIGDGNTVTFVPNDAVQTITINCP